ncbi:MAG TPA: thiol peroxidase [Gammaproteobacteria bacterium]|nr:thiol peroxidase [Gammaproteobacteria bacterium]
MDITFKGAPVHTIGALPIIGATAPDFTLVKTDFSILTLKELAGKNIVLNIFLSIDTAVCAHSVTKFNSALDKLENTLVLCVSMDLPFALERFCAAENLKHVIPVSAFRNPEFGRDYGVILTDGTLKGLLSRAIVVIDPNQKIKYIEQVSELTNKPNYDAVLKLF